MKKPTIRAAYQPIPAVDFVDETPSMTQQHFKDSCDINNILARYQETGVLEHVKTHGENYGFMSGQTFHEIMSQLTLAQSMFNDLPSEAREFFDHDPAKFLDYVDNPDIEDAAKRSQMLSLGLLDPDLGVTLPQPVTTAEAPLTPSDGELAPPPEPPAPEGTS